MNAPTNPPDLSTRLKALWGASAVPFAPAPSHAVASEPFTRLSGRLEQLVSIGACGLVYGPNGVGKTLLVRHFLEQLPQKRFKTIFISHSSVTGTDLLRVLVMELGRTPRMRRGDNLNEIRQAWRQLDRIWPVLVLDEAQNLSPTVLEEVRLLSCDRPDTQSPFTLLLVGDDQLLPRLKMGINQPLLARLGFCLHLQPWSPTDARAYLQARLEQAGIHSSPFEESTIELLVQSANGLPRQLNHLAQRALEEAAILDSRTVTPNHVHSALDLMPWVARV